MLRAHWAHAQVYVRGRPNNHRNVYNDYIFRLLRIFLIFKPASKKVFPSQNRLLDSQVFCFQNINTRNTLWHIRQFLNLRSVLSYQFVTSYTFSKSKVYMNQELELRTFEIFSFRERGIEPSKKHE